MQRRIREWVSGRNRLSRTSEDATGAREPAIVQEALSIRRAIIKQAASAKEDGVDIGDDLEPLLDTYVDQIRALAGRQDEMDAVVQTLPIVDLEKDKAVLIQRRTRAETDDVRAEYDKSIAEVNHQLASIRQIESNREVLGLRLRSAMNLMRQLQIDLARVKGMALTNTASFELLKEKSGELSTYLDDLESGYSDL